MFLFSMNSCMKISTILIDIGMRKLNVIGIKRRFQKSSLKGGLSSFSISFCILDDEHAGSTSDNLVHEKCNHEISIR